MRDICRFFEGQKNKKVLVVFPHPDDESVMAGGLIQRLIWLNFKVTVLSMTEGESGKIHINGKGRSVREIRSQEFAKAMSVLGVSDWILWQFGDGRLRKTHDWKKQLAKFLKQMNFGTVVSYDLSGVSGHPDHISLSRELLLLARQNKFVYLWVSFWGRMKEVVVSRRVEKYLVAPEMVIELSLVESWRKWRAAFSHKSQSLKGFLKYPWWILFLFARREWYSVAVKSKKYSFRYPEFKI